MYDDPPKEENYVNPYYRSHRTPVFKTDHPSLSHYNQGHLLTGDRVDNIEEGKDRMYQAWEPPRGGEERKGKKIVVDKPKNSGVVHQELE